MLIFLSVAVYARDGFFGFIIFLNIHGMGISSLMLLVDKNMLVPQRVRFAYQFIIMHLWINLFNFKCYIPPVFCVFILEMVRFSIKV